MVKKGITHNLTVGFKIFLINILSSSIVIVPIIFLIGASLGADIFGGGSGGDLGNPGIFPFLALPIIWILNGFFVNKYKSWIFK